MKRIIYLIIFSIFILLNFTSCIFSAGSYSDAERYNLNIPYKDLVIIIKQLKADSILISPPDTFALEDGNDTSDIYDYWYHLYFYYPKEKEIIHSWIRLDSRNITTLAFVGINKSLRLGDWKRINRNLSRKENEQEIDKFKKRILNKIIIKIAQQ